MIYPEFTAQELILGHSLIREWHQPDGRKIVPPDEQIQRVIATLDPDTYREMFLPTAV